MCIKAISWAWKQPVTDSGAKLVLLYLADCMNGKDGRCHPSIPTIATATGLYVRTVQRKLRWLEEEGLITVSSRSSANGGPVANSVALNFYPGVTVTPPGVTADTTNNERTGKEPSAYCKEAVRVVLSSKGRATSKEEALTRANGHGHANGHAWSNKAKLN